MMPPSPQQVDLTNQIATMDMDQQYFDDQIFSDIGGSLKQGDAHKEKALDMGMKPVPVVSTKGSVIQPSAASVGIASTTTVTKQKVGQGLYALHFSIYYETIVGESIAVVGNLGELGKWQEYKCHLIWTEGHIWRSTQPIVVRESYFEYKYVLLENDEVVAWEEGVNRIADLDALPEVRDFKDIEAANATPNMAKNNLNLNQTKMMLPAEYKGK